MRKLFLLIIINLLIHPAIFSQVAISTTPTTPNASSMLDVSSTSKGMLMPRMTTAQRKAIATPAQGLLVYDLDKNSILCTMV